jgi:alpha-L-arabinofuranosidase
MLSPTSLPQNYKTLVNQLFTNPDRERIEIDGIDEDFDEVEFELELNGKKKTFYVRHKNKIQPDIDVTNDIERNEQGLITTESLTRISEELINDVIQLRV